MLKLLLSALLFINYHTFASDLSIDQLAKLNTFIQKALNADDYGKVTVEKVSLENQNLKSAQGSANSTGAFEGLVTGDWSLDFSNDYVSKNNVATNVYEILAKIDPESTTEDVEYYINEAIENLNTNVPKIREVAANDKNHKIEITWEQTVDSLVLTVKGAPSADNTNTVIKSVDMSVTLDRKTYELNAYFNVSFKSSDTGMTNFKMALDNVVNDILNDNNMDKTDSETITNEAKSAFDKIKAEYEDYISVVTYIM